MRPSSPALALSVAAWVVACQSGPRLQTPAAPPAPTASVEATVFLVGDAGGAKSDDQVLAALRAELIAEPAAPTVVFLGDNVYPAGIPPEGHPDRDEAERRLLTQADAVRGTSARAIFIPGNHDWGHSGEDGWEAIGRQEALIAAQGLPGVSVQPSGGCPGPVTIEVTATLRLIVLDSQWWLHPHAKPTDPTSSCLADAKGEITAAIRKAVAADGGRIGVVAHHPLATGGVHGGHFSVWDHLFPLRVLESWLWVPLPILGSAYPIARMSGISNQDLSGGRYRELNDSLRAVFTGADVMFYAAGHEHNLQVVVDSTFGHMLVSGAGYFDHTTRTVYLEESRFAAARSGYMRLEILRDGRVRLIVVTVDAAGEAQEAFTMWLAQADDA